MPIDNAEKRRAVAGLSVGHGITPNAAKDVEWRQQVAWTYSGIEVIALVLTPDQVYIFLAIIETHDGASVNQKYLATEPFTSAATDSPANQFFDPRITDPGSFRRGLGLDGDSFADHDPVIVASADPGNGETLDSWLDLGVGHRPITILALPRGATTLAGNVVTLFNGSIEHIKSTNPLSQFEIHISDRLAALDLPLLDERYAGTTVASAATAEGNADLEGQIKQRVWGEATNVPVQPANPYDLIYLVSDGPLVSIVLYDGGLALDDDGDHASIALLRAAVILPGHYATCLALGLVRVEATPARELTADVIEGVNAAARTAAQIAYRMLVAFGIDPTDINLSTFTLLDADNDAVCDAFIKDDRSVMDAVSDVLAGIGARIVANSDGIFEVFRIEAAGAASADMTFDLELHDLGDTLELIDINIPVWRVVLEYGKVHHVQDDTLLGSVTPERRAALGSEYRTVTAEDGSVLIKHLNARELTVRTNLTVQADAQDEANRLLALLAQELKQYRVKFTLADAVAVELGSSISLVHDRLGMAAGLDTFVFERGASYAEQTIELNVRG